MRVFKRKPGILVVRVKEFWLVLFPASFLITALYLIYAGYIKPESPGAVIWVSFFSLLTVWVIWYVKSWEYVFNKESGEYIEAGISLWGKRVVNRFAIGDIERVELVESEGSDSTCYYLSVTIAGTDRPIGNLCSSGLFTPREEHARMIREFLGLEAEYEAAT